MAGSLLASFALSSAAHCFEQVSREQDIVGLRLGQRIQVDDGSCPSGQIKEVSGSQLSANGIVRVVRCIPRAGSRR